MTTHLLQWATVATKVSISYSGVTGVRTRLTDLTVDRLLWISRALTSNGWGRGR